MAFVLSLGSRKLYLYQFSQFGFCHMALLVIVGQSTLLAANVFSGFMWYAAGVVGIGHTSTREHMNTRSWACGALDAAHHPPPLRRCRV